MAAGFHRIGEPEHVEKHVEGDPATSGADNVARDGQPTVVRQKIAHTDFPLTEFSFYVIDQVMLLKSEY